MTITGINVELATSQEPDDGTDDAVYLGLYGPGTGGREFRLNGDVSFAQEDALYRLRMGSSCCADAGAWHQVHQSNPGQINHPVFNPMQITDVALAYIRKAPPKKPGPKDDFMRLDFASVLICDSNGVLRRFQKTGPMFFGEDGGMVHWLYETEPPICSIRVRLTQIAHETSGRRPAGQRWLFNFGAHAAPNHTPDTIRNILRQDEYRIRPNEADGWHKHSPPKAQELVLASPGCCGRKVELFLSGEALEHDRGSGWDGAIATTSATFQCQLQQGVTTGKLDVVVAGDGRNRESTITFAYEISHICIP